MPGRKAGHKETMPWQEALQVFGSEPFIIAGVNPKTSEGWKRTGVPAYRVLGLLREQVKRGEGREQAPGYTVSRGEKEPWEYGGWQERRRFTAMVEALRYLDAHGSDKDWATAWTAVNGLRAVLHRLAHWNNLNWKELYDRRIDHWRAITEDGNRESEEQLWVRRPMSEEGSP